MLNFNINLTDKKITITVETSKEIVIIFRDVNTTNLMYKSHIYQNMFSSISGILDDTINEILIEIREVNNTSKIIHNDFNIPVDPIPQEFIFNPKNLSIKKINLVKNDIYKKMEKDPILIGGLIGGGTSYIAKLLRYSGMFLGNDCGKITSRKSHESFLFKDMEKIITDTYIEDIDKYKDNIDRSVKSDYVYNEFIKNMEFRFSSYIGNIENTNKIWGFKFPANTMLSKFYQRLWKNLKIITIHRDYSDFKPSNNGNIIGTGYFFKSIAKDKEYVDKWLDTSHIKKDNQYHINFKKICTDYCYYNDLLDWIGLNKITEEEYNKLLIETGLEKDKL